MNINHSYSDGYVGYLLVRPSHHIHPMAARKELIMHTNGAAFSVMLKDAATVKRTDRVSVEALDAAMLAGEPPSSFQVRKLQVENSFT